MRATGRPFLLCTNYMDAHWPYVPPKPFYDRYPGRDSKFRLAHYYALASSVMLKGKKLTVAQREHLRSQYDSSVAYMDAGIGRLLRKLREDGVYDNSLIIVTSDHGEAFGEHGLIGHGVSVHQEHIHVPLLVKFPKGSPGEKQHGTSPSETVNSVDLLPTVYEVLGYPAPKSIDGLSILNAAVKSERRIYSESFSSHALLANKAQRMQRAVIAGRWKLIQSSSGVPQLYDLAVDAGEQSNLANSQPQIASRLTQDLTLWAKRAKVTSNNQDRPDRQTMDALKSLGYVQ
jgi:arylsulfatase A-like enzyme